MTHKPEFGTTDPYERDEAQVLPVFFLTRRADEALEATH